MTTSTKIQRCCPSLISMYIKHKSRGEKGGTAVTMYIGNTSVALHGRGVLGFVCWVEGWMLNILAVKILLLEIHYVHT